MSRIILRKSRDTLAPRGNIDKERNSSRSHVSPFRVARPDLGGRLSMANAAALYALPFAANCGYYFDSPTGDYVIIGLTLPLGRLFLKPIGGCIDPITGPVDLAFMCFGLGCNSFVQGYGLAALLDWTSRKVSARVR